MGSLYSDFEQEMATWQARYLGQPRRELLRLLLLALEREELVSVGYRESAIVARLEAMPLEPPVREVLRHALLWAWKDEEMHAIYVRGVLFRLGGWWLRATALAHQLTGAIAGWSTSVRQHAPWARAPMARLAATLISGLGWLSGKVPNHVWQNLRYRPFRDFCLFNVDAEKTAWLCWDRLITLAEECPELTAETVAEFRRVTQDEVRHERIFALLAAALGEDDRLLPNVTAKSLARQIAEVDEVFLPRSFRLAAAENPLGSGGKVHVALTSSENSKRAALCQLLDGAGLADFLAGRARDLDKPISELSVAIKPTFMMGYDRRDRSHLTDPELIEELALYLRRQGCREVFVLEAPNLYDLFFQNRSVAQVAEYFGYQSPHYKIMDASVEQERHDYARGMGQYTVSKTWRNADFRLLFGALRSHPVEIVHLSLGAADSLGARCDEFIFAERHADRETSTVMLLDAYPPHFAMIDGFEAADGICGVMGCPRPRTPRRLYAGRDALAVDTVAARHLGVANADVSTLLRTARHWFGGPTAPIEVVGCDTPVRAWRGPYATAWTTLLSFLALPVYVLASGRGTLFVAPMDHKAFPPVAKVPGPVRLGRQLIQHLLGLRCSP